MADDLVQIAPESTGPKVQTFSNTVDGQEVHAQGVVLVDSEDGTAVGVAATDPRPTDSGSQVRQVPPLSATPEAQLLTEVLEELRLIRQLLMQAL